MTDMTPREVNLLAQFISSKDDEILKLTADNKQLKAEIELLRAALDRAADALEFYDNKAEAQKARRALEPKP